MNSIGHHFATVLVARKAAEAPTELEMRLRHCSQKLRIVPSLAGGAHVIFPTSGTTVAVRVYDSANIAKLEREYQNQIRAVMRNKINTTFYDKPINHSSVDLCNESVETFSNVDGICTFRDAFKHSIVIFILPNDDLISSQLGRIESVVNVLQRCLSETCENGTAGDDNKAGGKRGNSRVFVVRDVESVLHALLTTLNSLKKEKIELKEKFFLNEAERNFLPDPSTGKVQSEKAAATHVSNAFRSWSRRMDVSIDDANVVMNVLGSLENIISADERVLDDVPISSTTKSKILQFFGNKNEENTTNINKHCNYIQYDEPEYNAETASHAGLGGGNDVYQSVHVPRSIDHHGYPGQNYNRNNQMQVEYPNNSHQYNKYHQTPSGRQGNINTSVPRLHLKQRAPVRYTDSQGSGFGYHRSDIISPHQFNSFNQRSMMTMQASIQNHTYSNNAVPIQQYQRSVNNDNSYLSQFEWHQSDQYGRSHNY